MKMETGCDLDIAVTNLVNRYTVSVTYKVPNEYDSLVTVRHCVKRRVIVRFEYHFNVNYLFNC